jgi:hypothetical protein
MITTTVSKPGGVKAINALLRGCGKTDVQSGGGLVLHRFLALEDPKFGRFAAIPQ